MEPKTQHWLLSLYVNKLLEGRYTGQGISYVQFDIYFVD